MTLGAYEQLLTLLKQTVNDRPEDEQVRRLSKGLAKALDRWLQLRRPGSVAQARSGTPRHSGLASVNASLARAGETTHGEDSRPKR